MALTIKCQKRRRVRNERQKCKPLEWEDRLIKILPSFFCLNAYTSYGKMQGI